MRHVTGYYNITSEEDLREAMQRTSDYVAAQPTQSNVTRLRRRRERGGDPKSVAELPESATGGRRATP